MKVSEIANVISRGVIIDVFRLNNDGCEILYKGLNAGLEVYADKYKDVLDAEVLEVFDYDNGEDNDGYFDCGIRIMVA